MTINEFADALRQDILLEADVEHQFLEDVFFAKACAYLLEAGDLVTAERVSYRHPSGVRVDGSGGDPMNSGGTLNIIGLAFYTKPGIGSLTVTELNAVVSRMQRFVTLALNEEWRNALEETSPAFGFADMIACRWPDIINVRLVVVSNRKLCQRVKNCTARTIAGKQATCIVWDLVRLHGSQLAKAPDTIEIDLANEYGGAIAVLPAQDISGTHKSYLAVIPGAVIAKIYDRWGSDLLEQNVRVFLQTRNKVNRGIQETLVREPAMFFAYNNGISAIADKVDIFSERGYLLLRRIKNLQIVNGGQTTASIHEAMRRGVDLSQVLVQMKLSVIDSGQATDIVPRISEYANSQNRVMASDFFSNHPFHIRVEEFSRRFYAPPAEGVLKPSKWFYERARGQYEDARAKKSSRQRKIFDYEYPRRQRFTKTDLAKFLSVWSGRPHEVSQGAQKNFTVFARRIGKAWQESSIEFNETWYRETIAKAILFKATERIVSDQPWFQGGFRANIVAYTLARLGMHVSECGQAIDFEAIWWHQAPSPEIKRTIAVVAERMNHVLTNPPEGMRNITEWAKKQLCWERSSRIPVLWPAELYDALISKQSHRNSVPRSPNE